MASEKSGCFLGSAGPGSFFSVFDSLTPAKEDGWYTFILKGGPGAGKSSLMKKLAAKMEEQDIRCERIRCSSDPGSLDAVIFPELKVCVVDGTAPHTLEPDHPGADSEIINLGFWDEKKLAGEKQRIISLTDRNRELHLKSRRFLDVCFSVYRRAAAIERGCADGEKLVRYSTRFTARSMPAPFGKPGKVTRRLLEAVTPGGFVFCNEYAAELCDKYIIFEDEFGAAAGDIIDHTAKSASAGGLDIIVSPSISGKTTRHLIIPEMGLGLFTSDCLCSPELPGARVVRSARFEDPQLKKAHRERLAFSRKAVRELLDEACLILREAGEVHDELEKIYVSATDFSKTDEVCETLFARLWRREWCSPNE